MKKILAIICLAVLIFSGLNVVASTLKDSNGNPPDGSNKNDNNDVSNVLTDFDPLVDIEVTIDFKALRALDYIDVNSDPDFFLKLSINDEEFTTSVFTDSKCLYDFWSVTYDVPDDVENVDFMIEVWDSNPLDNTLCDISGKPNSNDQGLSANVVYSLKSGLWLEDDSSEADISGYGRLNGCDDGSIYENEKDCELWFDITFNDYDNDGLPYWLETSVYDTNPEVSDLGDDSDNDSVPIEWEHRYGFNPFIWDDHENLDPDEDSLNNSEEHIMYHWGTDPFRQDLCLEIDWMEDGPNGESQAVTHEVKEMMKNPFHRRNIVYHIDIGEEEGGELIPFDDKTQMEEIIQTYNSYFLHHGEKQWRRGVFHYGFYVNNSTPMGYAWRGDGDPFMGYGPGTNGFQISARLMEQMAPKTFKSVPYIYASSIMHEMGHNFGIRFGTPFGCDNRRAIYPWHISYWLFKNYKSLMNYRYTYFILDYSDGSHGIRDFDDWDYIDLTYFEQKPKKSAKNMLFSLKDVLINERVANLFSRILN
jgi:hypothetical protein